jgi:adenylate cyclase
MAKEIERKFLVDKSKLPKNLPKPHNITQGYIQAKGATVRIRISDNKAYLTLKGKTEGISRSEFEYPIPFEDAKSLTCT